MRNVFDQYEQPENRLTHALVCTLANDRQLLRPFLRWAGAKNVPAARHLRLVEQQVPGEVVSGEEAEGEQRGVPDACVFDNDGWALLIESKVQATVSVNQLQRHEATAARHGYEAPYLLVLSVDEPNGRKRDRVAHRQWREMYRWFRQRVDQSVWAKALVEYLEVFETRMIAKDYSIRGTLTMFDGLRFDDEDHPYTYGEGKRLIRLIGDELQKRPDLRRIGVDPTGSRRSAITGRGTDGVWDFLPLRVARDAANFTDFPHLTLGIKREHAVAAITVPNGVKGGFRTKLQAGGLDGFRDLMGELEVRTRPIVRKSLGAKAMVYATQRHYKSQRSKAETDARLDVDLRTIVKRRGSPVKSQPQWVDAIYEVLTQKRANIQFGIDLHLSYGCPIVRTPDAIDLIAGAWVALSPLLDFVLTE